MFGVFQIKNLPSQLVLAGLMSIALPVYASTHRK